MPAPHPTPPPRASRHPSLHVPPLTPPHPAPAASARTLQEAPKGTDGASNMEIASSSIPWKSWKDDYYTKRGYTVKKDWVVRWGAGAGRRAARAGAQLRTS